MCIFFVRDIVDVVVVVAVTKQASRVLGQPPNPISRNVTMNLLNGVILPGGLKDLLVSM